MSNRADGPGCRGSAVGSMLAVLVLAGAYFLWPMVAEELERRSEEGKWLADVREIAGSADFRDMQYIGDADSRGVYRVTQRPHDDDIYGGVAVIKADPAFGDALAQQLWVLLDGYWAVDLDLSGTAITDAGVQVADNLVALRLENTAITPEVLPTLSQIDPWQMLDLRNTSIRVRDLGALELQRVEHLHLTDPDLRPQDLVHVTRYKRLKTLEVAGATLRTSDLKDWPELADVRLSGISFSEVSLDPVAVVAPNLSPLEALERYTSAAANRDLYTIKMQFTPPLPTDHIDEDWWGRWPQSILEADVEEEGIKAKIMLRGISGNGEEGTWEYQLIEREGDWRIERGCMVRCDL